jgi:hypothetical protein
MPLSNLSPRELEVLEAGVVFALTDPALPIEKRAELEQRLEAIRAKIALDKHSD